MTIEFPSRSGPYPVHVEAGAIDRAGDLADAALATAPSSIFFVTDTNVGPLLLDRVRRAFTRHVVAGAEIVPAGESSKSLRVVEALGERFARAGLDRAALVVALGGGVVTDLAGFAAAVFARGVRWVAIPTTLLAQVDAAVGGKTGVDLAAGKNLIGAFHAPRAVITDPSTLATLPAAEWRSGLGEVAKYALLDAAIGAAIDRTPPDAGDPAGLASWIERCVAVKARVCAGDETDTGARQTLNLGHTFGHAIEAASDFAVRHGEAVAIGLIGEAELAARLGRAERAFVDGVRARVERLGLPTTAAVDRARALRLLERDKKRVRSGLRFALPTAPGRVDLVDVADRGAIEAALGICISPRELL